MSQDPRTAGPIPPRPEPHQDAPARESQMQHAPDHGESSYVGSGKLKDRAALVTGGDSGIGRAVALAFAREGADVAIAYFNEHDDARETKRLVEQAGRKALLIPGDIADPLHCAEVMNETLNALQRLDVLVNNAAYQGTAVESIQDLDSARVERTFRTNVFSMFELVRVALPHLKPGASIINVASIQAYHPNAAILDYASTKGAIVTLTKGLAPELAKQGIRVNAVAPGPVFTPLVMQSYDEKKMKDFGKENPMGRPAQPAELAPAFVFLASDDARFVSGAILGVTGGRPLD